MFSDHKGMSMAQNVSLNELKENGMIMLYKRFYSAIISSEELRSIKKNYCEKDTILCVGGGDSNFIVNGKIFINLISCGNCQMILSQTKLNSPQLVNDAYWYFTPGYSFGFAPTPTILQKKFDMYNMILDELRLSWNIDYFGGGRLGTMKLEMSKQYFKYIFSNYKRN